MRTLRWLHAIVVAASLSFAPAIAGVALAQHGGEHADATHVDEDAELAHEEHGGEHHELVWDQFKLAGQLVNFAVWLFLMWYLLKKPLPAFLQERRAAIVDGLEEAKRLTAEAEAKHKEYSDRIANMDRELEDLRAEMRKSALDERDRIVKEASDKAEKMKTEARFLIDQQMKQLRADLTREAIEAAVGAAETILREKTTAQDQQRLADEYLGRLRALPVETRS